MSEERALVQTSTGRGGAGAGSVTSAVTTHIAPRSSPNRGLQADRSCKRAKHEAAMGETA